MNTFIAFDFSSKASLLKGPVLLACWKRHAVFGMKAHQPRYCYIMHRLIFQFLSSKMWKHDTCTTEYSMMFTDNEFHGITLWETWTHPIFFTMARFYMWKYWAKFHYFLCSLRLWFNIISIKLTKEKLKKGKVCSNDRFLSCIKKTKLILKKF